MEQNGSVKDSVPNLALKNQTDISTGIGPTGTDTPAPKDLMPHADEQVGFHNCTKRPFGLCRRINIALVKMLELNTNGDIHRIFFYHSYDDKFNSYLAGNPCCTIISPFHSQCTSLLNHVRWRSIFRGLWSFAHIHGTFCIFDEFHLNLHTILSKLLSSTLKSLKNFYPSYFETLNETLAFVSPRFLVTPVTPDIYNGILDMGLCAIDQSQMHSLKEPLSRPAGALFEVGSGQKCNTGDHSC